MKRRNFLKKLGISAAVASAGAFAAPNVIAKKRIRWRMVMAVPKTLPIWGPGMVDFAKQVKRLSNGQLDIRVYGANELVPALGVFDAVKNGEVQMGHSAPYYWVGKLPEAAFFGAVPFGMKARGVKAWLSTGDGQKLWDELYHAQGLTAISCGNTGVQSGGWFNKKIHSPKDFKGLKMRIPGLGGKVITKLGGKSVLVPGGEIFTNLATGVIDATEWVGPYHDYTMGFHKAAKYCYYPGWHEPGAILELMINKKAWDKLPKDLQNIVRVCAAETDRKMSIDWPAKDAEYLQKLKKETKVQFLEFPSSVTKALRTQADAVKAEVAATNPLAKKIYQSYSNFQTMYDAYETITDYAYAKAQKS